MTDENTVTAAESADAPADEEVIEGEAEELEPGESGEESEEETETEESDAEGETAEEAEELTAEQKKLAQVSFQLREQKRLNARMLKLLEANESRQQQANAPKPPKLEDFETIDEFVDAKVAYALNQGQQPAQQEQVPAQDSASMEFEVAREEMVANGIAKHADFVDVVLADDVDISLPMASALVEIQDPDLQVDTAYYLGKNPQEASRISRLTPIRQISEVAKITASIAAKRKKPVKQPSKAPKPIKPVGGKKTSSSEIQPDDDFETFRAKRNKQLGRT